jgi:hypothetical protein
MRLKRIIAVIAGCVAFSAGTAQAAVPGPALSAEGHSLKWTAVASATQYKLYGSYENQHVAYVISGLSATPSEIVGQSVRWKVKAMAPAVSRWSNTVTIAYSEGESQKEKEEREAKEKAEREQKEREERELKEKIEREEREAKEKEEREKEQTGEAGKVKNRLDARTEYDGIPVEWFQKLTRLLAYPTAGDRYPKAGVETVAYHDAWTTWGSSGATHKSEYVAWVHRDKEIGKYAGQFMDDINYGPSAGNKAGTDAQYRELVEAVRAELGPAGIIEMNSQYADIWPQIKAKNPDVLKALEYVNVVTKEFNVDATSGINSSDRYREFMEFTDFLESKKIGITMSGDSNHNGSAEREYSLATYYLVNDGLDYIGFAKQSPSSQYPGLLLNIGNATSPRERSSSGVWKRSFAKGVAYTVEPGAATQTITLAKPMKRLDGTTVSSVTLAPANGAVLQF